MAFNGYLSSGEITVLTKAAQAGGLFEMPRQLRLQGIPPLFVASLPVGLPPLDQFMYDLARVNEVERLADGRIPVVILLRNAAERLRLLDRAEADVFEDVLNRVDNATAGVPSLADPMTLPEVVKNEKIIGTDDMVDIGFLADGLAVARSVALIRVPRFVGGKQVLAGGIPWVASGTAWLIAPGLAITNHHVVNARLDVEPDAAAADLRRQALGSSLHFDVDVPQAGGTPVAVTGLVAWSPRSQLDYALLMVDAPAERPPLRIASDRVTVDETSRPGVNIIQHPRGEHKRVAFRNNLVSGADAEDLRYFTDTDAGSSGSPVCDDQWRVVALHRGALRVTDVQYLGRDTAFVNTGTQIQAVLEHIGAMAPAAAEQIAAAGRTG
jgi:endonuclease G, mitochondrial